MSDTVEKIYYTYNQIHKQLASLAIEKLTCLNIELIVAIGDGGYIPARILRSYLNCPIVCINVKSYNNGEQQALKRFQWLDNPALIKDKNILVVDEIDDTRTTLAYCVKALKQYSPKNLSIAILHNKMKPKVVSTESLTENYYSAEEVADKWIVYPWELEDLALLEN